VGEIYGLGPPISVLAPEIAKIKYPFVNIEVLKRVAEKAI